nr:MAG TPA: hypothetical protein [Caudoviricetes sp.]
MKLHMLLLTELMNITMAQRSIPMGMSIQFGIL